MRTQHVVSLIGRIRERANALILTELERRGHPDLAPSHGSLLATLYDRGALPMGELAKAIDRKKNTLTVLVRKLEECGYVSRQVSPDDSRVTLVALTAKGEAFRRDFHDTSETLLATVWGEMDQTDRERLVAGLESILRNME